MKIKAGRLISFLLVLAVACSFLQLPALAANNELVLAKIGHLSTNTITITSSSARDITLTVPYGYNGGTLDLSTGMVIEKATNIASFTHYFSPSASTASIGGAAVKMTVEYTRKNGTTDTTSYNIAVKRAAIKAPTFSGSISKSISSANLTSGTNDILFTLDDFTKGVYQANDGSIDSISIKGSNLACGTLKYMSPTSGHFENYTFNSKIPLGNIGSLAFDAQTSGTVRYLVYAYYNNPNTGSPVEIGPVELIITVSSVDPPSISSAVSKSVAAGSTLSFTLNDFTSRCNLNGGTLKNIRITPSPTDKGTWYNGSTRITGSATFDATSIKNLKYQSLSTAINNTASFTWEVSNEAGYSAPGNGIVNISNVSPPTVISAISKSTGIGTTTSFNSFDFTSRSNMNNGTLEYIEITPANSGFGTWYNGLSPFSTTTTFTSSTIGNLRFVPGAAGTAMFTWRISNQSGFSSMGTGTVIISGSEGLNYSTAVNTPIAFKSGDFYNDFYNSTGQILSHVKFSLPQPTYGTLYYNYSSYADSSPVTAGTSYFVGYGYNSKHIDNISFVPASDYTGAFTIAYTGYTDNGVSALGYIQINVSGSTSGYSSVTYSTPVNTSVNFKSSDFYNAFYNSTGTSLSYVTFTLPRSSNGTLYYDYGTFGSTPVTANTSYSVNYSNHTQSLDNISFVPSTGYTGTVTIEYKGYTALGITSYTGYIQIYVGSGSSVPGQMTYSTAKNTPVAFKSSDLNKAFYSATGTELSYVYFTQPSTAAGALYYNYASSSGQTKVSATSPYFVGIAPYLDLITYVPTANYTGTVTIPYTAYNIDGVSVTGSLKIYVGTSSSDSVTYSTSKNTAVTFKSNDIASAFYSNTGSKLSYVFFTLPSSSFGTLYYNSYNNSSIVNRTPVTGTTPYFVDFAPHLDYVTFVPANNYTGTVTISYTGYDESGNPTTGYIKVNVGTAGTGSSTTYTTAKNTAVTFKANDIVSAFYSKTGSELSYVFFTLPPSSAGTLYYGYTSVFNQSTVSSSTPYFVGTAPYLDYVTFVPANNYTGTVTISYTGYDSNGNPATGYIEINVGTDGSSSIGSVTLTTDKNTAVALKSNDIASAFFNATGTKLSYIQFSPPQSSTGALYYNYISTSIYNTPISESSRYGVDASPYISYITFVPASNFTGTANIPFTGYAANGTSGTGTLKITVKSTTPAPFTDLGSYTWARESIDYLYNNDIVAGTGGNQFSPGSKMKRGDFILMLYRAFDLTSNSKTNYTDVPKGSYYYDAIAAAKALGITREAGSYFNPEVPLTRQDAMYYTYRALHVSGSPLPEGTAKDIAKFTDKGEISDYALDAVQSLVKVGIITGNTNLKLNPLNNLNRAEMAAILYRALTL